MLGLGLTWVHIMVIMPRSAWNRPVNPSNNWMVHFIVTGSIWAISCRLEWNGTFHSSWNGPFHFSENEMGQFIQSRLKELSFLPSPLSLHLGPYPLVLFLSKNLGGGCSSCHCSCCSCYRCYCYHQPKGVFKYYVITLRMEGFRVKICGMCWCNTWLVRWMKYKLRLPLVGYLLARSYLPTSWGCLLSQLWLEMEALLSCSSKSTGTGEGGVWWMKCEIRLKLSQLGYSRQLGLSWAWQ